MRNPFFFAHGVQFGESKMICGLLRVRFVALVAILAVMAGCSDDPLKNLLVDPAEKAPAGLALSYSLASSTLAGGDLSGIDEIHVQLSSATAVPLDTVIAIPADTAGGTIDLAFELEMEQEEQTYRLLVELLADSRVAARGEQMVTLTKGDSNVAQIVMEAIYSAVSVGRNHSCHVVEDGTAYCWGRNNVGQLGDGSSVDRLLPVTVSGGITFADISASGDLTCGLSTEGTPYCWGINSVGTLGNGTTVNSQTPTAVSGGAPFASIDVGDRHVCGVLTGGEVLCWGENSRGQLGTTNFETCGPDAMSCSTVPALVDGATTYTEVAVGFWHTCGLADSGDAYCWGDNSFGQLGNGTNGAGGATPVLVSGGLTFTDLAGGSSHNCGLTEDGSAYCWGYNVSGQLGNGTTAGSTVPVPVAGGLTFERIFSNSENLILGTTCGITDSGETYCWGSNASGQLGTSTSDTCGSFGSCSLTPVQMAADLEFTGISISTEHACGVDADGVTYCWGSKGDGRLGDGSTIDEHTPAPVAGGITFAEISAGKWYHTCGLADDGTAYCWGDNRYGQLGDGTNNSTDVPVAVQGGPYTSIAGGGYYNCATDTAEQAFCWGENADGQLGDGTLIDRNTPTLVTGGLTWAWVEPTWYYVAAESNDSTGAYYFWGAGDPNTDAAQNPTPINVGMEGFVDVAPGYSHTCYLSPANEAFCRGTNSYGELGDGTNTYKSEPVMVQGGYPFTMLDAGTDATCGLTTGGDIFCWGGNSAGQLGDGTLTDQNVPVLVQGGHTFVDLTVGNGYACGITTDASAYCWGHNGEGRLGDGTETNRSAPTEVIGGHSWLKLSAAGFHTCGITTTNETYCWGNGDSGELGTGIPTFVTTPVAVNGTGSGSPSLNGFFRGFQARKPVPAAAPTEIIPSTKRDGRPSLSGLSR